MGKRHKPEEIIGKLREAEIVLAPGGTTADERGFTGGNAAPTDRIAGRGAWRSRQRFDRRRRRFPDRFWHCRRDPTGRCRAICRQAGRQESRRLCGTPRGQGRKPAAPGSLGRVRARRPTDRSGSCIPTCWSSGPRTRREAHLGRWSRCASPKDRAHHSPWHRALL
jgi:hypothetical protein